MTPEEEMRLGPEDLTLLESLFNISTDFPRSPIKLEEHREMIAHDEEAKKRFSIMILNCLRYVEDFAKHQDAKYSGDELKTQSQFDRQRTIAHNEMIVSVDAYYNWLIGQKNKQYNTDWKYWPEYSEENKGRTRVIYGKFAIALTLNRFKDQLIELKKIQTSSSDLSEIKEIHKHDKKILAIIKYIEILSKILEEDRQATLPEKQELKEIERSLKITEEQILILFRNLYTNEYETNQKF